ncbi:MAG: DUF3592 domain-containing protein [Ruminococcus albus]|nr:DUF3592 domain-containing protein [Ruminococcus albus]
MARRRRNSPIGMIFAGIITVLMTGFMIMAANREMKIQERCTANTSATITSVSKEKRSKKSGKRRTTYYVYRTGYEFDVDTSTYNGSTTLNHSSTIGNTIAVHYNPKNPNENYTNNEKVVKVALILPGLFGVVGVILIFAGISAKRKSRNIGGNYNNMGIGGAIVGAALSDRNNNYNSYNNQSSFSNTNSYNSYNNQNGFGGNSGYNSYNNQNGFGGNNGYNGYNNQNGFGGNNGYNGYNNQNGFDGSNGYKNGYNNNYNGGYNDSDFNQLN